MPRRWNSETLVYLGIAQDVIEELRPFWPVTLRQVYYRLVARQAIENQLPEYKRLSRVLTKARHDGIVPWCAIEDRARQHLDAAGWTTPRDFLRHQRDQFLAGYRRDRLQGQPVALEVWIEKDALSRVCFGVAREYCVPVVVARGFTSTSFARGCHDRVLDALAEGRDGLRILHFGDLDPSGVAMLPSLLDVLRDKMGLADSVVDGHRCALTPEQVADFHLPYSVEAIKKTDSRTPSYRRWLTSHGHPTDMAVELDALEPQDLQQIVRDSIEANLDLDLYHRQCEEEERDRENLAEVRSSAMNLLDHLETGL